MSACPKLLDLFCGPGGAGHGYELAGFQVWGVDVKRQRPPYMFTQAEALDYLDAGGAEGFHAIHASPPCQLHSAITVVSGNPEEHPDLIGPVRDRLRALGLPFVIENVPRAPLVDPELMCGAAVGLRLGRYILRRHRLFESNVSLRGSGCACRRGDGVSIGIYGGGVPAETTSGRRGRRHPESEPCRGAAPDGNAVGEPDGDRAGDPSRVHRRARPPAHRVRLARPPSSVVSA